MAQAKADSIKDAVCISALASRHGLSMRTLRFYEDRGLLNPMRASHTRFYSRRDQVRLQLILIGKRFGFSLAEIGEIIGYVDRQHTGDIPHDDFLSALDAAAIEMQIRRLLKQRDDLDQAILELRSAQSHPKGLLNALGRQPELGKS